MDLVAKLLQDFRLRTDENNARIQTGAGQQWIFRQKAVTRMDGADLITQRELDNGVDVQIGANRLARLADWISFIGFESMQRKPIFMGVHGDRANPQFVGGTKNPDGNFAA